MPYSLSFARIHDYSSAQSGIIVPAILIYGERRAAVSATVDTGAAYCLFARMYAEALGLDVENGERRRFATANRLGVEVTAQVYFFADSGIMKNVVGRHGWLDRIRLGLVDYDRRIYVAPYDAADDATPV